MTYDFATVLVLEAGSGGLVVEVEVGATGVAFTGTSLVAETT